MKWICIFPLLDSNRLWLASEPSAEHYAWSRLHHCHIEMLVDVCKTTTSSTDMWPCVWLYACITALLRCRLTFAWLPHQNLYVEPYLRHCPTFICSTYIIATFKSGFILPWNVKFVSTFIPFVTNVAVIASNITRLHGENRVGEKGRNKFWKMDQGAQHSYAGPYLHCWHTL